jgi:hypothetical protein
VIYVTETPPDEYESGHVVAAICHHLSAPERPPRIPPSSKVRNHPFFRGFQERTPMHTEWHESCSIPFRLLTIEGSLMRASAAPLPTIELPIEQHDEPEQLTLLELVRVVSEITDDEREVIATVQHMLLSGRVKLCGNFSKTPAKDFC